MMTNVLYPLAMTLRERLNVHCIKRFYVQTGRVVVTRTIASLVECARGASPPSAQGAIQQGIDT